MVPPFHKIGGVVIAGAAHRGEGVVRIDVDAVQGVHHVDEARKVDADVFVHRDAVQAAQGLHRRLHPVQAGVGQLVLAVGAGQVHIVVAGGVDQGHPLGHRVDHRQDVHVAAGVLGQLAPVVHPAEVDHKGLGGDGQGLVVGLLLAQGDLVQGGQALLGPDTAHRHPGAEQQGEQAGQHAPHLIPLALEHQQPEQHQQRPQDGQVVDRQHLGAVQLEESRGAERRL